MRLFKRENHFHLLKTFLLSNHYDLVPVTQGYQFTNQAGDQYYIYQTNYSLLSHDEITDEDFELNVYMLGFNCKRVNPDRRQRYDAKTKAIIIYVFKNFIELHPDEAFVYICDNRDGLARNRRIIFGRWFSESENEYERIHSHIRYGSDNWYSAIIVRKDNTNKDTYIEAFQYTLKAMLNR